ncbi:hypothetical protein [Vibrio alfacsensis]|uniref:hypothetical protein n=1 Tax=Vibrio alfacsensis TaxID=1074311 RepID=UPI0040693BC4
MEVNEVELSAFIGGFKNYPKRTDGERKAIVFNCDHWRIYGDLESGLNQFVRMEYQGNKDDITATWAIVKGLGLPEVN